jgi:hypothetical protein
MTLVHLTGNRFGLMARTVEDFSDELRAWVKKNCEYDPYNFMWLLPG